MVPFFIFLLTVSRQSDVSKESVLANNDIEILRSNTQNFNSEDHISFESLRCLPQQVKKRFLILHISFWLSWVFEAVHYFSTHDILVQKIFAVFLILPVALCTLNFIRMFETLNNADCYIFQSSILFSLL